MDEERDGPPEPGQPATADLLTIGLLVFFVSLIGIATALLVLPNLLP
ncbi:MAG: hypothetical protein WD116_00855 [Chloroflexota bacterium]